MPMNVNAPVNAQNVVWENQHANFSVSALTDVTNQNKFLKNDDDGNLQWVGTNTTAGLLLLDNDGLIPPSLLPSAVMEYKGLWNPQTNNPTLTDGVGSAGDIYQVGYIEYFERDLGSGDIEFYLGDWVAYNGTIWEKSIHHGYSKIELDALLFNKLNTNGGTMNGALNMGTYSITNAQSFTGTGSITGDAVYADGYYNKAGTKNFSCNGTYFQTTQPITTNNNNIELGTASLICGEIQCSTNVWCGGSLCRGFGDLCINLETPNLVNIVEPLQTTTINTNNNTINAGTSSVTATTLKGTNFYDYGGSNLQFVSGPSYTTFYKGIDLQNAYAISGASSIASLGAVTCGSLNAGSGLISTSGTISCNLLTPNYLNANGDVSTGDTYGFKQTSGNYIFKTASNIMVMQTTLNMNSNAITNATTIGGNGTTNKMAFNGTYIDVNSSLVMNSSNLDMNNNNITNVTQINGQNLSSYRLIRKYTDSLTGDGTSKTLNIDMAVGENVLSIMMTKNGTVDYTYQPTISGVNISCTASYPSGSWLLTVSAY